MSVYKCIRDELWPQLACAPLTSVVVVLEDRCFNYYEVALGVLVVTSVLLQNKYMRAIYLHCCPVGVAMYHI